MKILCLGRQLTRLALWDIRTTGKMMTSSSEKPDSTRERENMGLSNQKVHCEKKQEEVTVAAHMEGTRSNMEYLRNPHLNKGMSFSEKERNALGLRGLLPPAIRTQEAQTDIVMSSLHNCRDDLQRYKFLRELQDTDECLFYRVLCDHMEELFPIVYTPIVGLACTKYSSLFLRPRGLFISINDRGRVHEIINNWPEKDVKAIVVTDGERILGLGDLGCNGMGIPVGKLALYTTIGGVSPHYTIPVTIDVGTNNESLLVDPDYIGLRQKRIQGTEYDALIDEFMDAVMKRFGRSCLVQFEDFGNHNAFRLLEKYKDDHCTFNDDIQGTASVAVAGLLASLKAAGTKLVEQTFLFFGAGEAAMGTADLLVMAMKEQGTPCKEAVKRIWLIDSQGLIVKNRPKLSKDKQKYAKSHEQTKNLHQIIKNIKPSVLIGVAAQPGAFSEDVLTEMASINDHPIIFALSNPTEKAECTAEEAYTFTQGRCIFASGSPFDPVIYKGKKYYPGQGNNAYIFPAVSFAAIHCEVCTIPNEVFLVAAQSLADQVTPEQLNEGRVYPPLNTIRETSLLIAAKVADYFYAKKLATLKPEPADKIQFLKGKFYDPNYNSPLSQKPIVNGYFSNKL